jgi:hypothetical protein
MGIFWWEGLDIFEMVLPIKTKHLMFIKNEKIIDIIIFNIFNGNAISTEKSSIILRILTD